MNELATVQNAPEIVPADADKHHRYRLGKFADWLDATGRPWTAPNLAAYRDDLHAQGYAPATISAHLSTVRGRYRQLLRDNATRDRLFAEAVAYLDRNGQPATPANRKAYVDEAIQRLENAIDPAASSVKLVTSQDTPDAHHLRLTPGQAGVLMASPGILTDKAVRDTAILAMLLCTGVREAELCALDVPDLRQRLGGELALHVRKGKGAKERLIPYGELSFALYVTDVWLKVAGIEDGPVYRGLYKGGSLRPGRLSVRAVQYIVGAYPVMIDGRMQKVKPHDLRRTYARQLYEAGMAPVEIQQNLGHANLETTLGYIGTLDADRRRPPAIYPFDLTELERLLDA